MSAHEEERKNRRELKWKELMSRVDAYRFYIKLILEVNAFFYATTGAVVLVYLNKDNEYLGLFLLLPILMGTVVGGFMLYATALQEHQQTIIERIRRELEGPDTKIDYLPDLKLLSQLLWVFGHMFLAVALVLSFVPLIRAVKKHYGLPDWWNLVHYFTLIAVVIVGGGFLYSKYRTCKYAKSKNGKQSTPEGRQDMSPAPQAD